MGKGWSPSRSRLGLMANDRYFEVYTSLNFLALQPLYNNGAASICNGYRYVPFTSTLAHALEKRRGVTLPGTRLPPYSSCMTPSNRHTPDSRSYQTKFHQTTTSTPLGPTLVPSTSAVALVTADFFIAVVTFLCWRRRNKRRRAHRPRVGEY